MQSQGIQRILDEADKDDRSYVLHVTTIGGDGFGLGGGDELFTGLAVIDFWRACNVLKCKAEDERVVYIDGGTIQSVVPEFT